MHRRPSSALRPARRRFVGPVLFLVLGLCEAGVLWSEIVPLYEIPVTVEGEAGVGTPQIKVRIASPESLLRRDVWGGVDEGGLVHFAPEAAGSVVDPPAEVNLVSTFLVDFEEAPVQELLAQLSRPHGSRESLDELVDLTDRSIPRKTMLRSWDAASVVVRRGEGDCTEHAVLLAALARGRRMPARVVMGALVALGSAGVVAYGHAWTEIWDGAAWQRADASQRDVSGPDSSEPVRLFYLPMSIIENEGPGYSLPLATLAQKTQPAAIVVSWPRPDADR